MESNFMTWKVLEKYSGLINIQIQKMPDSFSRVFMFMFLKNYQ